jgi:ABC-type sugar transport system ATPase subunit
MAAVRFRGVHERFGLLTAVEELDLEIDDRKFLVVVGSSGCGKSATLRMLAGLERPSNGLISIGDRVVNPVSPKSRDVAVVFQNDAQYPHMTVYDNLSFGMRIRREPRGDERQRHWETRDRSDRGRTGRRARHRCRRRRRDCEDRRKRQRYQQCLRSPRGVAGGRDGSGGSGTWAGGDSGTGGDAGAPRAANGYKPVSENLTVP